MCSVCLQAIMTHFKGILLQIYDVYLKLTSTYINRHTQTSFADISHGHAQSNRKLGLVNCDFSCRVNFQLRKG